MISRNFVKTCGRFVASIIALPMLLSFTLRKQLFGANRALEGSTQALALWPGILGQYVRRAFLSRVLDHCASSATVEFGTMFSQTGARIEENAYIGPHCHIGLVSIERDVLIAAGVHIPSGAHSHGTAALTISIRDQPPTRTRVRIGEGSWVGSGAVVMASVGANTVIGAGAVITRAIPANVVAAGVPARVIRERVSEEITGGRAAQAVG
jgi:virginiamycin A acetyltransferase